MISKHISIRDLHRAQVYSKNEELRKLEKENFEKLKADVASGSVVLDEPIWSTGKKEMLSDS